MDMNTDVLIVGAGPVGLTVANELRRRDVAVTMIEKTESIREISKALILHVRTQEVLSHVGIIGGVQAEAEPLREVVVHTYNKHIGSWYLDNVDSTFSHPMIIGQNRTQHLLAAKLAERGTAIEWNTELKSWAMDTDGVTATVDHTDPATKATTEKTIRARYIVGCEGSNSVVRKTLGLTFEGERYSGEQFIQADCKIRWTLPTGRSYLFLTTDGYMMVIEMPHGMVRVFISLPDKVGTQPETGKPNLGAAEDVSHEPTLQDVQENLVRLSGIEAQLSDSVWLARYRTSHRYADKFRVDRAFVAGDAGHVHVPIGGQGMNTGIQDGFNLGWKLAGVVKGVYQPQILDTYNAERHPVAEALIRGTDFAYRGILHPSEIQQRAARTFGPFVIRMGPVQKFMRGTLEELNINYTDTPLAVDHGGSSSHGPKPGERVLDAPVVRGDTKATVRLSEITQSAEWVLLLFGGTLPHTDYPALHSVAQTIAARYGTMVHPYFVVAATALPEGLSPASCLIDAEEYLHEKYGVTHPAIYLLRPDTYVGFRGTLHGVDALMGYLAAVFVPKGD